MKKIKLYIGALLIAIVGTVAVYGTSSACTIKYEGTYDEVLKRCIEGPADNCESCIYL